MHSLVASLVIAAVLLGASPAGAQNAPPVGREEKGGFLLTILFTHDRSRPPEEIDTVLRQHGFYKAFPPAGVEVVSWYEMVGAGQMVTLRVPPGKLRDVNRALEQTAWGVLHTELYPTYELKFEQRDAKTQ